MLKNPYIYLSIFWFAASIYALFFKISPSNIKLPFEHFDKVVHCGLFFAQTWLIGKVWLNQNRPIPYFYLMIPMVFWAITSEILQTYLTSFRHGDAYDALADTVGIFIALFFLKHSQSCKIHPPAL